MDRKLGVIANCFRDTSEAAALPYLKAAGFDCCFLEVAYTEEQVLAVRHVADDVGMEISFLHTPWYERGNGKTLFMNELWYENGAYESLMGKVKTCINAAAEAKVETVILHLTEGWDEPPITDIGNQRFDEIVDFAVKRGVKVAIENLFTLGALAVMLERYKKVPEVGFCYDNGHEHCYMETIPYLDLFGKQTFCVHLHDNYGRDKNDIWKDADYHLLPFDGTFDFANMMRKLDHYGYKGPLMLELGGQRGKYADMSNEAYAAHLFSLVKRIANAHK